MPYPQLWMDLVLPDLTHLVADGNYTWLHYKNRRKVLSSYNVSFWQQKRLQGFIRINRSVLINPAHVTHWLLDIGEIRIGKERLAVSRRQLKSVREICEIKLIRVNQPTFNGL